MHQVAAQYRPVTSYKNAPGGSTVESVVHLSIAIRVHNKYAVEILYFEHFLISLHQVYVKIMVYLIFRGYIV